MENATEDKKAELNMAIVNLYNKHQEPMKRMKKRHTDLHSELRAIKQRLVKNGV